MEPGHIKKRYQKLFTTGCRIQIGEGWFWLLSGLCDALDKHGYPIRIESVEHRLGSMNLTYQDGDDGAWSIICAVQLISHSVCQQCAGTSEVGGTFGPAIHTLCKNCWSLDEQYHTHYLSGHVFGEAAIRKIEAGLERMPENWFRKRLLQILYE